MNEDDVKLRAHRDAYDEAVMWLQRLAGWGWGENAPDNAIQDWKEARAWLNEHGQA